ncbi:MAG TPA: hypothetical protein VLF67_00800 [Candidatus Saccharimonas sp.]|nr:hypothetical protein [Candidatus Saccharimonas sp.]
MSIAIPLPPTEERVIDAAYRKRTSRLLLTARIIGCSLLALWLLGAIYITVGKPDLSTAGAVVISGGAIALIIAFCIFASRVNQRQEAQRHDEFSKARYGYNELFTRLLDQQVARLRCAQLDPAVPSTVVFLADDGERIVLQQSGHSVHVSTRSDDLTALVEGLIPDLLKAPPYDHIVKVKFG